MFAAHQLDRFRRRLHRTDSADAPIERTLFIGDEASTVICFAEKNHADPIVMGTHGRAGLSRLLTGSVAETVLRKAPCPVLTIKTPIRSQLQAQPKCAAMATT